jgi:cytochrome P450
LGDEIPLSDAVIRETLRICLSGTALRRNLHQDIKIGGHTIERGAFMAYSADVHLNEELYPNPEKFDPGRFLGKEDIKGVVYPYLGGELVRSDINLFLNIIPNQIVTGRHPCPGMRVAKLGMKTIVAMFVLGYNFDLVDKNGKSTKNMPQPDRNHPHQVIIFYFFQSFVRLF